MGNHLHRELQAEGNRYWLKAWTCQVHDCVIGEDRYDAIRTAGLFGKRVFMRIWLKFPNDYIIEHVFRGRDNGLRRGAVLTYVCGAKADNGAGVPLLFHVNATGDDIWCYEIHDMLTAMRIRYTSDSLAQTIVNEIRAILRAKLS